MEGAEPRRQAAARRNRLAAFVATVVIVYAVLALMGAPPLLILEVFGLAIIIGISALILILVMSGRLARRVR